MSFQLKIVRLDQAVKIKRYLAMGWEPFAVHRESSEGTKLYLRREDKTEELKMRANEFDRYMEQAQTLQEIYRTHNTTVLEVLTAISSKLSRLIAQEILTDIGDSNIRASDEFVISGLDDDEDEDVSDDVLDNPTIGFRDEAGNEVNPDDVLVVDRPSAPFSEDELEDSRLVEKDVKDEETDFSSTRKMTQAQEGAIKEIRKSEKVNLTINPVNEDGTVTVLARTKIFSIERDGAYAFRSSKAKTGMTADNVAD